MSKYAFTLIELLVVVAILGVIATFAVPIVFSGHDGVRVTAATQMIMSDLLFVQNAAITQQQNTYVYFLNGTPPQAYTAVYFPSGTVAAPTWADVQTGSYDFGAGNKFLKQPSRQAKFRVQLGPGAPDDNGGPMVKCKIMSVSPAVFGFDTLGQPIGTDGQPLSSSVNIVLGTLADEMGTQVTIAPITGEISVGSP